MSDLVTPIPTKKQEQALRDQSTYETYLVIGNWVEVAKQMNYANGSCARRAGMRHAFRNGLVVQSAETPNVA